MKKLFFLIGCVFFKLLYAAPVGNPSFPGLIEEGVFFSSFNFRIGYEGNFLSDRRLKQKTNQEPRVNNFSQSLNSATLTFTLLNRLDLFGVLGKGRIKTDWIIQEVPNAFSYLELETRYKFNWAAGTKIIFFEWGNAKLSFGGRYNHTNPSILWINKTNVVYPENSSNLKFKEWQADVGVSYKIDFMVPYIAAKYSKAQANLSVNDLVISSDGSNKLKMKNKTLWGMALGCSLVAEKYFMLNLEARMIDEEALTISGDFKF